MVLTSLDVHDVIPYRLGLQRIARGQFGAASRPFTHKFKGNGNRAINTVADCRKERER